jgi:structure-specific endonuclease subunit SLX1
MRCLSQAFLSEETERNAVVPTKGTCPGCRSPLQWSSLIKELSLRTRGQAEVEALFKPRRQKAAAAQAVDQEDEDLDETWVQDVEDEEFPSIDAYLRLDGKG